MGELIRGLLIGIGYVEEQGLALLPIHHGDGFATAEEAVADFAQTMLEVRNAFYPPKKPCKECGQGGGSPLAVEAFFRNFFSSTLDGTSDIDRRLKYHGWTAEGYMEPGSYAVVSNFDGYLEEMDLGRKPKEWHGKVLNGIVRVER